MALFVRRVATGNLLFKAGDPGMIAAPPLNSGLQQPLAISSLPMFGLDSEALITSWPHNLCTGCEARRDFFESVSL